MFFSFRTPRSMKRTGSLFPTYSRTVAVTMISPGAASLVDP
jgi:hypothetical protein